MEMIKKQLEVLVNLADEGSVKDIQKLKSLIDKFESLDLPDEDKAIIEPLYIKSMIKSDLKAIVASIFSEPKPNPVFKKVKIKLWK